MHAEPEPESQSRSRFLPRSRVELGEPCMLAKPISVWLGPTVRQPQPVRVAARRACEWQQRWGQGTACKHTITVLHKLRRRAEPGKLFHVFYVGMQGFGRKGGALGGGRRRERAAGGERPAGGWRGRELRCVLDMDGKLQGVSGGAEIDRDAGARVGEGDKEPGRGREGAKPVPVTALRHVGRSERAVPTTELLTGTSSGAASRSWRTRTSPAKCAGA